MFLNESEIRQSGLVHYPLPLHPEHSLEEELKQAAIKKEKFICPAAPISNWHPLGDGTSLGLCDKAAPSGKDAIYFQNKSWHDIRPKGRLEEGDCSNFGSFGVSVDIASKNWEAYNRIAFYVKADCAGLRHVSLTLCFQNDGAVKIPDIYSREGFHIVNLRCGQWTACTLDIDTLPRDCITSLSFRSGMAGCDTDPDLGNSLCFSLGDICLQQTEERENTLGWSLPTGRTAFCYSGYLPKGKKTAVSALPAGSRFAILEESDQLVFSGITTPCAGYPTLSLLDFSSLEQPGMYRIQTDTEETVCFPISTEAYSSSVWKTINFLFCERCGYPVPGSHKSCHRDIMAHHNGKSLFCCGGWHDAGDVSQQLVQTAEITYSLFEAASAFSPDDPLALRLREEALWGLDYVLNSRFGDGYRATSVGISMWTRGFIGDKDDLHSRMHNNAYDNFLCAATEAYAAMQLREEDPMFSARLIQCARDDFSFAQQRFEQTGFEERPPEYWEHTYMTSPSLFAATISFSGSMLFQATGEHLYADIAAEYGTYVISCQALLPVGRSHFPTWGFFYRSPEKKSIQHFNHQSRDQLYMQALVALCETQPAHPSYPEWLSSIQLYADYLKALMAHGSPYGMMPSGLYRLDEINDTEAFSRQHLETGDEVYEDYRLQLENSMDVGDGFYLKQFPVWFSFRGNNAIILSTGKAASLCGRFLKDQTFMDIAAQQLEWNIGKNPFRQSFMYGEGRRYAQQYAVMPGEMTGELPVGVQTLGNGDEPYWPQMNNATYKEVWTTPSARWLSIVADLTRWGKHK